MLLAHADHKARLAVASDDLVPRLNRLATGELLTLIGLDESRLRATVGASVASERRMLELDFTGVGSTAHAVARILDDLADLALALWPNWAGGGTDSTRMPEVLAVWRRPAARLAASGQPPRFRSALPRVQLRQLLAAIDPAGLVLVATLDPAQSQAAAAHISALEWCAGAGASVVILCPKRPPNVPPFDRVLYDAIEVCHPPRAEAPPVIERLIFPQGKAHGGSDIETRVQAAILRDDELATLFKYNKAVMTLAPGFTPRVDLIWEEGRVVVELDGPEHQGDPNYGNDRHRDYELTVAGYLVLRLTNAQVATDLQLAIEKIRRVVRYRRSEGGHP